MIQARQVLGQIKESEEKDGQQQLVPWPEGTLTIDYLGLGPPLQSASHH